MTAFKGTNNNDFLQGGDGDDRFTPLRGRDVVIGGAGVDTLVIDYGTAAVGAPVYNSSSIFLDGTSMRGSLVASDGSSIVNFSEIERITGTMDAGDNLLYISGYGAGPGAFNLDGGQGEDRLAISAELFSGNFDFILGTNDKAKGTLGTFSGFESYEITLGTGSHHVVTGAGADGIYNYRGSANISTGAGDDLVVSYYSVDLVNGGSGYDWWSGDYELETVNMHFAFDGSSGSLSNGTTIANIEKVTLVTGSGNDTFYLSAPAEVFLTAGSGFDTLFADYSQVDGVADEVSIGTSQDGTIYGNFGSGGMDNFENVTLISGNGDTYLYLGLQSSAPNSTLTIDGGGGNNTAELAWIPADPLYISVDDAGDLTSNAGFTLTGFDQFVLYLGAGADDVSSGDGDDIIYGLAGNDRLDGGGGADIVYGGLGADVYIFDELSDLATDGLDWLASCRTDLGDKIDVQGLSAGVFAFLGDTAFSGGGSAELRYTQSGGNYLVEGDIDGDGVADFQLLVTAPSLTASDFWL